MRLSQKLKELRKTRKMSQEQLSKVLNVTSQAISKWETGKSYPDILNLVKISDTFNISLDELIKEDISVQKNLYNKSMAKNIYILFLGIVLEGFSYLLLCYFEEINFKNSLTDWFITIIALTGFAFIGHAIYDKLPKRLRMLLNSIFS